MVQAFIPKLSRHGWGGRFTTVMPDEHVATNIRVIDAFLPLSFGVRTTGNGLHGISCDPV